MGEPGSGQEDKEKEASPEVATENVGRPVGSGEDAAEAGDSHREHRDRPYRPADRAAIELILHDERGAAEEQHDAHGVSAREPVPGRVLDHSDEIGGRARALGEALKERVEAAEESRGENEPDRGGSAGAPEQKSGRAGQESRTWCGAEPVARLRERGGDRPKADPLHPAGNRDISRKHPFPTDGDAEGDHHPKK